MAKLRNAKTDVGKFTQYLARKCVIHQPQAELDAETTKGFQPQRFGTNASYHGAETFLVGRDGGLEPHQFVAISPAGRAMLVTVEEMIPEEAAVLPRKEVGD